MTWGVRSKSERDSQDDAFEQSEQARPPGKRTLVESVYSGRRIQFALDYIKHRPHLARPVLQHRRAVQRRLISPSEIRERWEDATMGLTARQALDLSTSLSWTGRVMNTASTRPVHLETLKAQAESLLADLTAFAQGSELTSRALGEIGPAVPKAVSLQSLIEGAMKPVPEVRKEVGRILFGASASMLAMRKPYLGPAGSAGSVELESQAHLLDLIAQGRDSEDGLIPGTEIEVGTDEQEAQVRAKYMPLEDTSIDFVDSLSDEVDKRKEELGGSGPGGSGGKPLESVKADLEELVFVWGEFSSGNQFSEVLLPKREKVRTAFDSAHKMVIGKLAPIENTVNLVVQMAAEIETTIQSTLALPQRRDPERGDAPPTPMPGDRALRDTPETFIVPEQPGAGEPVQHRQAGGQAGAGDREVATATAGLLGTSRRLPHLDRIQRSFGAHDVSDTRAHSGDAAAEANEQMGSLAYAMGNEVAFADSQPDLFTAAHEAAHVVQQRAGAIRDGEVGAPGDTLERHADEVAERVVSGESAEEVLDRVAPPGSSPSTGLSHRAVQHSPKAGVEMGTSSIKVALSVEPSREIPCGKAKLTFAAPVEVAAELKSKAPAGPVDASGGGSNQGGGGKVSVTVYQAEAREAGEDELMNLIDEEMEPSEWQVEEVKWEGEGAAGENEAGGGRFEAATAVVIKFKNGQETTVKATLFGSEAGSGMTGPKAEIAHKFEIAKAKLWENEDAELSVGGTVSLKLAVEPNWTRIFADLAAEYGKRGGLQIARNFLRSTLQGLCGTAGFVAGGVITIFSFGASIIDAQEVEETIKAAQASVAAYARGYTLSWGMDDFGTEGPDRWFQQGYGDGGSRLVSRAEEVISHPAFAPWGFQIAELTAEMKQVARDNGLAGDVYSQVEGEVQTKIYEGYVKAFYEQQNSSFFTPEYIARNNAEDVARVLGVDADAVLPPPED